jgi:formamidopyrimidine-DNA glycosylase
MPEMLEVEAYRRLADQAVGRRIASLDASDAWFLKGGITSRELEDALVGRQFSGTRRVGKLLLMDVEAGPTLGLRFGMTGRLLVDDAIGVNELQYSSHRLDTGSSCTSSMVATCASTIRAASGACSSIPTKIVLARTPPRSATESWPMRSMRAWLRSRPG